MPEIIAPSVNNACPKAVIAVLDLDSLQGHALTSGDYFVDGFKPADHVEYIKIPRTILGKIYFSASRYNFGESIAILSDGLFNVAIADGWVALSEGG